MGLTASAVFEWRDSCGPSLSDASRVAGRALPWRERRSGRRSQRRPLLELLGTSSDEWTVPVSSLGAWRTPRSCALGSVIVALASTRAAVTLMLGPRRPDRLPGAHRRAQRPGPSADQRPPSPGPPGSGGRTCANRYHGRRRARLAPARRPGSAARRPRSRWPSRSAGCGPSPAPSSRSSPARRAPARSAVAGSVPRLAATVGSVAPSVLSRVLGLRRLLLADDPPHLRRTPALLEPSLRRTASCRSAARRAARPASRCRCGCRRRGWSSSACSGLMYSGVPTICAEAGEQRPLGQRLARSPWPRRSR